MATQTVTEFDSIAPSVDITPLDKTLCNDPFKAPQIRPLEIEEPTEQTTEAEPDYPKGTHFWLIFVSLGLVLILGGMDTNIVATAVPSVSHSSTERCHADSPLWG